MTDLATFLPDAIEDWMAREAVSGRRFGEVAIGDPGLVAGQSMLPIIAISLASLAFPGSASRPRTGSSQCSLSLAMTSVRAARRLSCALR